MALFNVFDVAGSGLAAQSLRLNTVASNLANAESVSSTEAGAFRARHPVFTPVERTAEGGGGVRVTGIAEEKGAPQKIHSPGHPMADADGYIYAAKVDPVAEMVDMISASRSYQNSVEVMNTSKELLLRTLMIGQ